VTRLLTTLGLVTVLLPARCAVGAATPPQKVDLGRLALGQRLIHELHVENTDEIPLDIARVTSTCKCVKILERPETVMPGDKGAIRAEVLVNVPGDYAFGVKVHPWEPDRQPSSFLLLVTVPRPKGSNPTFYVSASDILGGALPDVAFVDVRRAPPGTGTLPGAMRLPLHAVKTTRSLRSRPVVLIDDGWRSPSTELACFQLRQKGFTSVQILDGGVQAWAAAGGALAGQADEPPDALSPDDYLASRGFTDWIVVDAGTRTDDAVLPNDTLRVGAVPEDIDRVTSAVKALTGRRGGLQHVLVVGRDDDASRHLAAALKAIGGAVVFRLEGGGDALARHMRARETRASGRSLRTSRTVGGRRPARRIRRSCGGCS